MNDDLEQRLQRAFRRGPLPPAPPSLVEALQRVPDAPVTSRRSIGRRSTFGLLAAALIVATVGALATVGGSTRPSPPTSTPAPVANGLRLEYQLSQNDGFLPGSSDLERIMSTLEARIATTGVVGATVEAEGLDRIIVSLPGVTEAEPVRRLIGQTGRIDFVPLGSREVGRGETIDLGQYPPLFELNEVASASVSADQNGQPAIDLILTPEGTRLFADYTAQNIGTYFAVTIDGVVLTAPIIQSSIPNGDVQITGGSVSGFDATEASTLVTILKSGPLLFPIHEIGAEPIGPSPT
jgi:preprotein translocase subunit SecD